MSPTVKKIVLITITLFITGFGFIWYLGGNVKSSNLNANLNATTTKKKYTLTEEQQTNLQQLMVNNFVESLNSTTTKSTAVVESIKNVKTKAQNDIASLTTYGRELAIAFKPIGLIQTDAANLVIQAIDNQDVSAINTLKQFQGYYNQTEIALTAIVVPSTLADKHLATLNSVRRIKILLELMSTGLTETVSALQAAQIYHTNQNILINSISDISKHLLKQGVIFTNNETIKIFIN